ncbi:MAG: hypothetical protein KDE01_24085 [Caldilineaceae bacterium]|nr:hypothetical protein [Caldilineaceae bacterium]MCB9116880.1 hypothetical protein [Caldilineaceae bacterium]MCB9126047.1 hypothetical protein [Caldilineaceae bacterium]
MLTSRERDMAAVDHREPDRVPIDLGGHPSSGVMANVSPKHNAAILGAIN